MKISNLVILVILTLASCSYFINSWEDGLYSVSDVHGASLTNDLNLKIPGTGFHGRITEVDSICSDKKYIIACNKAGEYFILNKDEDRSYYNADKIVQGPYSRTEFINRKKELDIENLIFCSHFE